MGLVDCLHASLAGIILQGLTFIMDGLFHDHRPGLTLINRHEPVVAESSVTGAHNISVLHRLRERGPSWQKVFLAFAKVTGSP